MGDEWVGAAIILGGFIGTYHLVKVNITDTGFFPLTVTVSLSVSLFGLPEEKAAVFP